MINIAAVADRFTLYMTWKEKDVVGYLYMK